MKCKVDKLDIGKLGTAPVDLSKLIDAKVHDIETTDTIDSI